jgi:hypothetical protein
MTRSTRSLGGSLALLALAFSFTETMLASVCAPGADMSAMPGMADLSGPPADGDSMGAMPGMAMSDTDTEREAGEGTFDCPLAIALGPGCSALASLPAPIVGGGWLAPLAVLGTPFEDIDSGVLLTHALYRPPRA